jgi:hypothetical protein
MLNYIIAKFSTILYYLNFDKTLINLLNKVDSIKIYNIVFKNKRFLRRYLNDPLLDSKAIDHILKSRILNEIELEIFLINLKRNGYCPNIDFMVNKSNINLIKKLYKSNLIVNEESNLKAFTLLLRDTNSNSKFLFPLDKGSPLLFYKNSHWRFIFENYEKIDASYFLELFVIMSKEDSLELGIDAFLKFHENNAILNLDLGAQDYIISQIIHYKFLTKEKLEKISLIVRSPSDIHLIELRKYYLESNVNFKFCADKVSSKYNHINALNSYLELSILNEGQISDDYALEFLLHKEYLDENYTISFLKNLPTFTMANLAIRLEKMGLKVELDFLIKNIGVPAVLPLKNRLDGLFDLCNIGHFTLNELFLPEELYLYTIFNIKRLNWLENNSKIHSAGLIYVKNNYPIEVYEFYQSLVEKWEGSFEELINCAYKESRFN